MPAKKKKGKGSKLARMNDEERLRYLQHRAELELEAKRRKQELIAVFTKNKLKREQAFARLNTAKINEQWRFILRQIKCKELYDEVDYLWKNFDRTLKAKDAVIHKLYNELEVADLENRRTQETHMDMIDKLIGRLVERLESMRHDYNLAICEKENGEIEELNILSRNVANERKYLETVIFAQAMHTKEILMRTQTRNAINTCSIEHAKEDDISIMRKRVGGHMERLWEQLNNVLREYEFSSADKRKQYEYLKEQDNASRLESLQFVKQQSSLQNMVENLRENYYTLMNERSARIDELTNKNKRSDDSIRKLRQEIRIHQTMDAVQLKRMSVLCITVIKHLESIKEKGSTLLLLVKMCSGLEPTALAVKKYAIHCAETIEETNKPCVTSPYDKMEKFWEQYNYVKAGNIHRKSELDQLTAQNKRLRQTLRNYLITLSRVPLGKQQKKSLVTR
ncbi:dynein regulatory complex subunit 2 [Venturia canescens]|uniref:dynein regulatory complex subunit 2 n=1 Tax=Venturia canescens TaxID=32260 RepID=UPI001C9BFDE2|nr:dynein regulatory complex subunit 2 [Venturia canescens]